MSNKSISPQNLLGIWEHVILKQVEKIHIPTHGLLASHAFLKGISEDNKTVTIVFKDKMFLDFLKESKDKLNIVSKSLYQIFGQEYKIILEHDSNQEIIRFKTTTQKIIEEMAKHDDILRHKLKKLKVFGFVTKMTNEEKTKAEMKAISDMEEMNIQKYKEYVSLNHEKLHKNFMLKKAEMIKNNSVTLEYLDKLGKWLDEVELNSPAFYNRQYFYCEVLGDNELMAIFQKNQEKNKPIQDLTIEPKEIIQELVIESKQITLPMSQEKKDLLAKLKKEITKNA